MFRSARFAFGPVASRFSKQLVTSQPFAGASGLILSRVPSHGLNHFRPIHTAQTFATSSPFPAEEKTAFITGGVSGIGLALCEELVKRGIRCLITDMNEIAGAKAMEKLEEINPGYATFAHLSCVDRPRTKELMAEFWDKYGRFDYLFSNAGVAEYQLYPVGQAIDTAQIVDPDLTTVEIDLMAVLYQIGLAVQYMRRNPVGDDGAKGRIIPTASIYGVYFPTAEPMYVSAKHGLHAFVKSRGPGLKTQGILLNAVCPGITRTPMIPDATIKEYGHYMTPMETVVQAFTSLLETQKAGQALMACGKDVLPSTQAPWGNESLEKDVKKGSPWPE